MLSRLHAGSSPCWVVSMLSRLHVEARSEYYIQPTLALMQTAHDLSNGK